MPTIKQVLPTANIIKEVRANLLVLLFTRLALQGIVCYTFVFRVVKEVKFSLSRK